MVVFRVLCENLTHFKSISYLGFISVSETCTFHVISGLCRDFSIFLPILTLQKMCFVVVFRVLCEDLTKKNMYRSSNPDFFVSPFYLVT